MPFTSVAKNSMLDALFAVPIFASLHDDVPDSSGSHELTGGTPAYARQPVVFQVALNGEATSDPTPVVTFDVPPGSTAAFLGLWDADTAGNFLGYAPANGGVLTNAAMAYVAPNNFFCPGAGGLAVSNKVILLPVNGILPAGLTDTQVYTVLGVDGNTFTLNATTLADGPVHFQRVVVDVFGSQGTLSVSTAVFGLNG
jgi:hypothetical protein